MTAHDVPDKAGPQLYTPGPLPICLKTDSFKTTVLCTGRWQCGKMQSSCLPTTRVPAGHSWEPWHPRRWEEPPSELVGCGGGHWGGGRSGGRTGQGPWGVAESREGFPRLERPLGAQIRGSGPSVTPAQSAGEVSPALGPGPMPSEVPSGLGWSWRCKREAGRQQERQVGGALQDERSSKGAEGICPAHSGPGSLLSSQADLPLSKAHSRPRGSWGPQVGGQGDQERQVGGVLRERSKGCLPWPLEPRQPARLPGGVPCPLRPEVGGMPGPLVFSRA